MARSDYEGAPQVPADTGAPDDYQHVQSTPDAFGGAIARGVEQLGAGATQASMFYGQVAADNATNNWREQADKILYGDPNNTDPATGQPDTGYFGKVGAAAMQARPEVMQKLDELKQEQIEGLSTPRSREQFETDTRRYRMAFDSQVSEHADRQQKTWMASTFDSTTQLNLAALARDPNNANLYADTRDEVRKAEVRKAQLITGEEPRLAILRADQQVAEIQVRALLGSGDAVGAMKALNNNREILSSAKDYDSLNFLVTSKANDVMSLHLADALSNVGPLNSLPGTSTDLKGAILGQESGGNNAVKPSVTGAVGPMQIEPDTFKRFARPGEAITNPSDNRAVGGRYVDYLSQKYQGDQSRVATAYFSGEGNVSPPGSPTPWIKDKADPTGKTVSSYVGDIGRRTGNQNAISNVLDGLNPDQKSVVMDKAVAEMHRRILETKQINAINDDPARTAWMWHGIDTGQVTPQDVLDATRNGYFTSGTAAEMMKSIDNGPKRTAVEKDSFDVLKTALSGGAIDQGAISIFPQAEQAKAKQNWAEAQGEWSRRVLNGEDPRVVLNDMVPRYAPSIQHPTWLAPLQFGMVNSLPDVNKIAVTTYQARQTNKIDQATYDKQVALLNQYKIFYGLQDRQLKAREHAKGNVPKPPKPPASGVTVAPEANP